MRGLICDDHPLMRQAFQLALQARWPDLVLSEAATYPQAWLRATEEQDLIMLDLAMPGATPIDGVIRMRTIAPEARLIVLTGLTDAALLDQVKAAGVAAILPKTLEGEALLDRIEQLVPQLVDARGGELPPRQREVLRLLGEGFTNKEIAIRLGIAPATVKVHVSRLIDQLGAANRTDAVSRAQRAGII